MEWRGSWLLLERRVSEGSWKSHMRDERVNDVWEQKEDLRRKIQQVP